MSRRLPQWWPTKISNIVINPYLEAQATQDRSITRIQIHGVVCDLCLTRGSVAIADQPNVELLMVDRKNNAILVSGNLDLESARSRLRKVIVMARLRRILGFLFQR
jgi:hypothetical protein